MPVRSTFVSRNTIMASNDLDQICDQVSKVDLVDSVEKTAEEGDGDLKARVRREVCARMRRRNLLVPFDRHKPDGQMKIPYFKGCDRAAERAFADVEALASAKAVKVNPSLAQMHLRKLDMRAGQDLLVPVQALEGRGDPFMLVAGDVGPGCAAKACTKAGAVKHGRPVGLDFPDGFRLDVVVVGCVAVSREGVRLGKGRGLAELEWGVLWSLGVVDADTLVMTTAHEAQIVSPSKLPKTAMGVHDLPVDVVVTPKRVIWAKERLAKPTCGVLWDLITEHDLEYMPLLKELKAKQQTKQKSV